MKYEILNWNRRHSAHQHARTLSPVTVANEIESEWVQPLSTCACLCLCRWTLHWVDVKRQHQFETDRDFLIYQSLRLLRASYTHSFHIYSSYTLSIHSHTHAHVPRMERSIFFFFLWHCAGCRRGRVNILRFWGVQRYHFVFFFFFQKGECWKKSGKILNSSPWATAIAFAMINGRFGWGCQLVNHLYIYSYRIAHCLNTQKPLRKKQAKKKMNETKIAVDNRRMDGNETDRQTKRASST